MSTTDPVDLNCSGELADLDRADMQRLATGQSVALNDLMSRHAQALFSFLFRMLGSEEDANDVAQEAFVRVYQHAGSFKPELRFNTWLFTIAANLARNHHRWRARHPALSLDAPDDAGSSFGEVISSNSPTPDQAAVSADQASAVRAAVDALPPEMREAIILCEWEDCSVAEAAEILEVKPKAVENRLYRARVLLREKLKGWI